MKQLVICADDFALNEPVSRAIIKLGGQGHVSATSVMVLSPRWPGDAPMLRDLRGRMDVGLHLDWTSAFAIQAGHGVSLNSAMVRAAFGGFDRLAAREVIARQLDAFEAHWQAPPDHVDGHQHVQQFAGIRGALVELISQRYGQALPYLRLSRVSAARAGIKGRIITAMGADALEKVAGDAGIGCVGPLAGVYGFDGDLAGYAHRMEGWLTTSARGGMIMCHPAQAAQPDDEIGAARLREYDYLGSDEFAHALAQAQVAVTRGAALSKVMT